NFVKYARLPSGPAEPELDFLDAIRGKLDRVCPAECTARQVERNGECIAKVCPNGLILNEVGNCVSGRKSATPSSGVDEKNTRSKARPQETSRSAKAESGSYDPYDANRRITASGQVTCGSRGCQRVPEGCHAVRGAGGHKMGGKVFCP